MTEKEKIAIASDHAGVELKAAVDEVLEAEGFEVLDLGPDNPAQSVDYPDYGKAVAKRVSRGDVRRGVLICGTGIGMSLVANKFPGVRAALVHDCFTAEAAKEHNNANILVLGARVIPVELAKELVKIWLRTEYAGGRHQRRLDKISELECRCK
ncbi:Ribose 5-phosphate isomerase B [hydrothermal vent metagenome]|uniref:Ribose 5-phosphate isomerase B n=1 Tax=hydrothermal vent metagenome TaxID=652676 RepID=A0A3B0UZP5_9ZZZZ